MSPVAVPISAAAGALFLIFHLSYLASCIAEKREVSIGLATWASVVIGSCVGIIVAQAVGS